jgi:hypothetical protein
MSTVNNNENEQLPSSDKCNCEQIVSCKSHTRNDVSTGNAYDDKTKSEESNQSGDESNSDNCCNNNYDVWDDEEDHTRHLSTDNGLNTNGDDIFDAVIGYYEPSKDPSKKPESKSEQKENLSKKEDNSKTAPVAPKKKKKYKKPKNVYYEQDEYDAGYDDTYDSYYD